MKNIASALLALPLAGGPALASGSIECAAPDGDASVTLTIGSLPVLAVAGAQVDADGRSWILNGEGENSITVGQAFRENGSLRVDFTDSNVNAIVAELRLFSAVENKNMATAGTLRVAGVGAWAVTCSGP